MPAVALAYGSFGDILSTAQLVIKIVQLLRQSGSPSGTWRETENELKTLGGELAHLSLHRELEPLVAERIQQEVARCHLLMARFFAKINASQGLVQKILWAISEEKELLAFRAQIIERRSALGVLVGLVNSGALEAVRARVEDVGSQVRVASESLSQQLATYQTQIVGVIAHVPHGISEQLFTVVSPNGVPIPISLAYCTSYQTLDQLLKTYLQGRSEAGILYVKRGDYNIVSPDGEVVPPPQFTGILKSNLRLEMCIVKSLHFGDGICPQCKYSRPATRSANGWSACQNPECGARFQILLGSALLPPQVKPPRDPGFELGDGPELFRRIRIMATKSMKEDLHFVALVVRVARLAAEVALWKEGAMRLRQILQKAGVQVEFEPLREEAKLQRLES